MNDMETLLNEAAKPLREINKENLFRYIGNVDATENTQMIYFIIDSLIDYTQKPECPYNLAELLQKILENNTITPVLFQYDFSKIKKQSPEVQQIIDYIKSI